MNKSLEYLHPIYIPKMMLLEMILTYNNILFITYLYIQLPMTMLACARIGAIHSVVFSGLGTDALATRISDCCDPNI